MALAGKRPRVLPTPARESRKPGPANNLRGKFKREPQTWGEQGPPLSQGWAPREQTRLLLSVYNRSPGAQRPDPELLTASKKPRGPAAPVTPWTPPSNAKVVMQATEVDGGRGARSLPPPGCVPAARRRHDVRKLLPRPPPPAAPHTHTRTQQRQLTASNHGERPLRGARHFWFLSWLESQSRPS